MEMCQEDVPLPLVDRMLYVLSFGYMGTFMLSGVLYLPGQLRRVALRRGRRDRRGHRRRARRAARQPSIGVAGRSAAVAIAACLIMAVVTAAMVTTGRSCVQFWHMRYSFYTVTFITCAAGVLFGVVLQALPRWISPMLAVALLVVAVNLGHDNYMFVQTSSRRRPEAGLHPRHRAASGAARGRRLGAAHARAWPLRPRRWTIGRDPPVAAANVQRPPAGQPRARAGGNEYHAPAGRPPRTWAARPQPVLAQ